MLLYQRGKEILYESDIDPAGGVVGGFDDL